MEPSTDNESSAPSAVLTSVRLIGSKIDQLSAEKEGESSGMRAEDCQVLKAFNPSCTL